MTRGVAADALIHQAFMGPWHSLRSAGMTKLVG